MNSDCEICKAAIKSGQGIICQGGCTKNFHLKCVGLVQYDLTQIREKKNLLFMCDKCIEYRNSLTGQIETVLQEVRESKKRITDQELEIKRILDQVGKLSERDNKLCNEIAKVANSDSGKKVNSYANVLKREPALLIKPKKKQEAKKTKEDLRKKVDPSNLRIMGMTAKQNGNITIESVNSDETKKIKSAVEDKLSENYEVKIIEPKKLKVVVVGMNEEWKDSEIIEKIKSQNDYLMRANLKCLKISKMRGKYDCFYNALLQVDEKSFKEMLDKEKINIGWDRCKVFDGVSVKRCHKCKGFNHEAKLCKNEEVCGNCNGSHHTKFCDSERSMKCVNCAKANEKLNLKLDVDHNTMSRECPVYINKLKIEKKRCGYEF